MGDGESTFSPTEWADQAAVGLEHGFPGGVRLRVELCTVYWHFLLLVWLVLFGLMLST